MNIRKIPRCKHNHVSGRRCPEYTSHESKLCPIHRTRNTMELCPECVSMRASFVPPKGW